MAITDTTYTGLKTDVYTYLTVPGPTQLLLSLPHWSVVTLRLETAGPVSVGTREDLSPVGSGKGRLLPANEDIRIVMVPLTRLYIAADAVQRVAIQVEPYPWLFEILNAVKGVAPALSSMLSRLLGRK
jgi:hypothetical protein